MLFGDSLLIDLFYLFCILVNICTNVISAIARCYANAWFSSSLLKQGMRQHYELGRWFRETYASPGAFELVSGSYNRSQVVLVHCCSDK